MTITVNACRQCEADWIQVLEWLDEFTLIDTYKILFIVRYRMRTTCEPLSDSIGSISATNPFQHKQPQRHQRVLNFRCGVEPSRVLPWL